MTREAAILGVPSVSFFRGRRGAVDDSLEARGRLQLIENVSHVEELTFEKRECRGLLPDTEATIEGVLDSLTGF